MPRYIKLGNGETDSYADPGPPSLRRAHSTRERPDEGPRKSISKPRTEEQLHGFLRRAKSSREHPNDGNLGPLEAAVHRAVSGEAKQQSSVEKNLRGYSGLFRQQQQQPSHLPRTQSMRYNRIVSADSDRDEDDYGPTPPRHSCVDKMASDPHGSLKDCPRMVRISASYQTTDGEILSIECAQCGRWLGTVAQKVNLEQGTIKLCQICHPVSELKAPPVAPEYGTPAPSGLSKKGNSFLRGLRRILGLKKSR